MCLLCKHTVGSNRKEPAGLTPTPPKPFHTIAMDFKGPLKDSSYALVMLDLYSKWPEVYSKKTGPWNGHSSVIFPSWKPEGISKNGNNTICLA